MCQFVDCRFEFIALQIQKLTFRDFGRVKWARSRRMARSSRERKEAIDKWLWNEESGQYYDYDYVKGNM